MTIVFVYTAIMLYMTAPILAFVLCSFTFGVLLVPRRRTFLEGLLASLVMSMPLYSISVFGVDVQHFFSWTTILLCVFVVYTALQCTAVPPGAIVAGGLLLGASLFTIFFVGDFGVGTLYYFAQHIIFLAPILFAYVAREQLLAKLTRDNAQRLVSIANQTITATALAVISQYGIYRFFGISVGNVSQFGGGRVVFDLTINAFSMLSILLGVGVVLNLLLFQKYRRVSFVLGMIACVVAIVLNTSRTGLLAAIVISVWLVTFPPKGSGKKARPLLLIVLVLLVSLGMYLVSLIGVRGNLSSVLDDNGRIETYSNALKTSIASWQNVLLGIGYEHDGYPYTLPHNAIIEMLLSSGVITTVVMLVIIFFLLRFIRGSEGQYLIGVLILSSMVVTGFYAVKFVPVIVVCVILQVAAVSKNRDLDWNPVKSGKRWSLRRQPNASSTLAIEPCSGETKDRGPDCPAK